MEKRGVIDNEITVPEKDGADPEQHMTKRAADRISMPNKPIGAQQPKTKSINTQPPEVQG